ncbi:DUF4252 domain-containing protein [Adhaeretor mobilis]|uniref:DUF4252 domain-containing protein n=1 Tax=Adhaeretor mobilis TaxID=1930276 RepID=A0A517N0G1_9BACT|nr:DUF4252 domain-containing protein [Adhaeretor mobilis]QDT00629.1 hypothetical protein HG15A2_39680 [Adhaeretor mobilis]
MVVRSRVFDSRTGRRKPRASFTLSALAALAVVACGSAVGFAQSTDAAAGAELGRIEFDYQDGPEAVLEVDLGKGMLTDVSGLIEAALAGLVEGLLDSEQGDQSQAVAQTADYVNSVQQIVAVLGSAVSEVRVRGFDRLTDEDEPARTALIAHYQQRIRNSDWDDLLRVKDHGASAVVSVLREEGAIRGLFVMGSEGNNLILVNVVCDLSPEKVKTVTKQLAELGMKFGLKKELEKAMQEIQRELH